MGAVLCTLLLAVPAAAFSAERLDILVLENGDADVQFTYTLSWFEHVFVFLRVVDPAVQLEQELESYSGKDVVVQSVSASSATLQILAFATVREADGQVTYRTPELQFHDAADIAARHWWAHIVRVDFRPVRTTVTFPDAFTETFVNAAQIPGIVRTTSP
jgi:hypothetical protein